MDEICFANGRLIYSLILLNLMTQYNLCVDVSLDKICLLQVKAGVGVLLVIHSEIDLCLLMERWF